MAILSYKPINWAKCAALICGLMLIASCQPQKSPSHLAQIKQQGMLKVGTRYGMTTYFNGASGPEGFEFELALGFAEYIGVNLEVYPYYSIPELFEPLENEFLDVVAGGITATQQRRNDFKIGPEYQRISQKLVFKQGAIRPRKPSDLKGELLIVAQSAHAETMRSLNHQELNQGRTGLSWKETDEQDPEELLQSVLNEEINYTIADSSLLNVMRRRHPELSIGFTVQQEQKVAWLMSKHHDDSLYAKMIEYFGELRGNGKLTALEDKYFGHVKKFNYVDTTLFLEAAKNTLPIFEPLFRKYASEVDWRLIAAMSYQESHWDPRAKSPTGVRGMMMLTLPTARDWGVKSRLDAEQSIRGGTKYFESLIKRIPARIENPDKMWFALAAYNIGLGHLEDARVITQRMGGNPDLWVDVKNYLPYLRQKRHYKNTRFGYARGDEAANYVENIRRYYDSLVYLYADDTSTVAP